MNARRVAWQIGFFALLLGAWQGLALSGLLDPQLLPGPLRVLGRLVELARSGALAHALFLSLGRALAGYLLSCALGVLLGVAVYPFEFLSASLGSLTQGMMSLPAICLLPLAALWFQGAEKTILLVVVLGSLFSIAHATENGIRHVPPVWVRAARTMGSRGWRLAYRVLLPGALPSILTGLKQGWAFAWRALMAGELLSTAPGMGRLLQQGKADHDAAMLFGLILVILLVGLTVDFLVFSPLEARVRHQYGLEV